MGCAPSKDSAVAHNSSERPRPNKAEAPGKSRCKKEEAPRENLEKLRSESIAAIEEQFALQESLEAHHPLEKESFGEEGASASEKTKKTKKAGLHIEDDDDDFDLSSVLVAEEKEEELQGKKEVERKKEEEVHKKKNFGRKITRANTVFYSRVHEAAMRDIFRSGNGKVGLRNLGNTCYMNASVQALCHVVGLADYFLGMDWTTEINEKNPVGYGGSIARAFGELLEKMWQTRADKDSKALAPTSFKGVVSKCAPNFAGNEQHDAHEFLTFLLDALHEDLNRCRSKPFVDEIICDGTHQDKCAAEAWRGYLRRDRSIVVDLFQGQLRSSVQCAICGAERIKFETFMYLSVPVVDDDEYNDNDEEKADDGGVFFEGRHNNKEASSAKATSSQRKAKSGGLAGGDEGLQTAAMNVVVPPVPLPSKKAAATTARKKSQSHQKRKKKLNIEQCIADFSASEKLDGDNLWHCEKCGKHVPATKRIELWKLPPVLIIHLKRFKFDKWGRASKLTSDVAFPLSDLNLRPFCMSSQRDAPLYDCFARVNHHGAFGSGHYTTHARNRVDGIWHHYNDSKVSSDTANNLKTNDAYVLFYARVVADDDHNKQKTTQQQKAPDPSRVMVRRQSISLPHLWPHYQDSPDEHLAQIPLRQKKKHQNTDDNDGKDDDLSVAPAKKPRQDLPPSSSSSSSAHHKASSFL